MLLSSVASSVVLSGFLVRRGIRALVALRDNLALLVKVLESREQTQAPPLVVNVQDAKRQGTALFEGRQHRQDRCRKDGDTPRLPSSTWTKTP